MPHIPPSDPQVVTIRCLPTPPLTPQFSTRAKCHPTEGRSCPMMLFSDPIHEAVKSFMRPEFYHSPLVDVNDYHWNTTGHVDTSAGFFGALLALHLCGEVRRPCLAPREAACLYLECAYPSQSQAMVISAAVA